MDVRIGIAQSGQVIEIEMPDDTDRDALKASITAALGTEGDALWFADKRGKETVIPSARVSFVELGTDSDDRRIGFGA